MNIGEPVEYKGVTIQVRAYFDANGRFITDYGYTTDIGILGAGQRTAAQALADAKRAIDEAQLDKSD
jgi:hypothetical protein